MWLSHRRGIHRWLRCHRPHSRQVRGSSAVRVACRGTLPAVCRATPAGTDVDLNPALRWQRHWRMGAGRPQRGSAVLSRSAAGRGAVRPRSHPVFRRRQSARDRRRLAAVCRKTENRVLRDPVSGAAESADHMRMIRRDEILWRSATHSVPRARHFAVV